MPSTIEPKTQLSPAKQALLEGRMRGVAFSRPNQWTIVSLPHRQKVPLSFAQQRLWFLQQLEPHSAAYNLSMATRLYGPLNVGALDKAMCEIVRRHEILRTRFGTEEGRGVQIIDPAPAFVLKVHALCGTDEDLLTEVPRVAAAEASQVFDLSRGPLVTAKLLVLGHDEHVLIVSMHHIVSDGWSVEVVMREIGVLYDAFSQGQHSPLPDLEIQYGDYSVWQREWLQGAVLQEQLEHWRGKLAGAVVAEIPADYPRSALQLHRAERINVSLAPALVERIHELCKAQSLTPFMALLTAFQLVVSLSSGERDVTVGTDVANRRTAKVAGMIGFFVNQLVLRTDLSGNPTVRQLLARVREVCLDAYIHQDLPFERLVEELNPDRGMGATPLFQAKLVLQNASERSAFLSGLRVEPLAVTVVHTKFDLALLLTQSGQQLSGFLEFNADCFERARMERLLRYWERVLKGLVADPDKQISELEIMDEAERRQVVVDWNRSEEVRQATPCIHELFEERARNSEENIALSSAGKELSYSELNERANQLAHYLRELGVRVEGRVGLFMDRGWESIVGMLGILKAGACYVPLDPKYPAERLGYILSDAQTPVLLTQEHLQGRLPSSWSQVVCIDLEWSQLERRSPKDERAKVDPRNAAYIIYTSGSTGKPKGVVITHEGLVNLALARVGEIEADQKSRILQFSSLSFDASVFEWARTLCSGATLVIPGSQDVLADEELSRLMKKERVSVVTLPPSVLSSLKDAEFEDLRTLVVAGEACGSDLVGRWANRCRMLNAYGPTEGTVCATVSEPLRSGDKPGIGRPLANVQMYVLDERMNPTPVGVAGELYIGGAGLARGYWNRAHTTAERFIPNAFSERPGQRLYKTGDLGAWRADGTLEYLGRVDEQVKVRGCRVEPGEIEAALRELPWIADAAVLLHADHTGQKRLVAYVAAQQSGMMPQAAELREQLRARLPDYMIPNAYVVVKQLPLTPNRKVDRRALAKASFETDEQLKTHVPPQTEAQEILCGIWSRVLGLANIGIEDNFFAIGGDSIRSIQVVAQAKRCGLEFTVRQLFEYPTVKQLAQKLRSEVQLERPIPDIKPFGMISDEDRLKLPPALDDAYPLAQLQAGMFFHTEYDRGTAIYHDVFSYHLRTHLDVPLMRKAVQDAVKRHPVLRTSFDFRTYSEPLQLVHRQCEVEFSEEDISALSMKEQEEALRACREQEKQRPFNVESAGLLRFQLHRRSDDTFQFTMSLHHGIGDGWSGAVLQTEMFRQYFSELRNVPTSIEPPRALFRDFVYLERQSLQSEEAKAFWQQQISDTEVGWMPWKSSTDLLPQAAGIQVPISSELSGRLAELARHAGVSVKSVVLAAHARVINLISGRNDVLTGLVSNGRVEVEDGERVQGLFLNTVPFRIELTTGSWLDLIRQTAETERRLLPYRRFPAAQVQRMAGRTSLFETAFNFVNFHLFREIDHEFELEVLDMESFEQTNFPLFAKFSINISHFNLQLHLEYNAALLEREQVDRIAGYYLNTLQEIAESPEGRYDCRSLLSEQERIHLREWNNTEQAMGDEGFIHEMFEAQELRTPQHTAIVFEDEELSYAELNSRTNRLAHFLGALGIGVESRVGVFLERSVGMVFTLLAILKAGAAYVPLDPDYPQARLALMLTDADVAVVVTDSRLRSQLPETKAKVVTLDADADSLDKSDNGNLHIRVDAQNSAYVIYTSGSTGGPKAVVNTHGGIRNRLLWMQKEYQLDAGDRVLQKTPFSFDVSVWEFFWPLITGATLVVAKPGGHRDPGYLADLVNRAGITTVHFVPSMLTSVLGESNFGSGSTLRRVICSGEALSASLVKQWYQRSATRLHNLYGPTEAAVDVTSWECPDEPEANSVPIGRPISNITAYVLDERRNLVPAGVVGEIYIGGIGLARGYLNKPSMTAERFVPNPLAQQEGDRLYRTGDLGKWRPDGVLEFLGRSDDQVKIRGYRIELSEIAAVLGEMPGVENALVIARSNELDEKKLVAYLVGRRDELPNAGEFRAFLRGRLPEQMIPSAFVRVESLPLTTSGKVDRRALPGPSAEPQIALGEYVAPRTDIEELVCGCFARVLGLDRIGVLENFFERGGHSLLATQVISRLRQLFATDISLRDLYEAPTPEGLARVVATSRSQNHALLRPPVRAMDRGLVLPLSYAQQRLWFMCSSDPSSAAYNMPRAVLLKGLLHTEALEQSLREIARRHEILRTRFTTQAGEGVQVVEPKPAWLNEPLLQLVDLRGLQQADRETESGRHQQSMAAEPFDLTCGPLFRARLLMLGHEEYCLLLTMHHIASDGWSMGVLTRELSLLYGAFVGGQKSPLPELKIQYGDYAVWQRGWFKNETLDRQLGYWTRHLAGAIPLELPTDHPRPALSSRRGAREQFHVDPEITKRLRSLCRSEGTSLFMVLLAAYQLTLGRFANQYDVTVGATIANRHVLETEPLIGFFVNMLLLRSTWRPETSLRELLHEIRTTVLQANENQDLPFERLIEELPRGDHSLDHGFARAIINYENQPAASVDFPGLLATSIDNQQFNFARTDLDFYATDTESHISGILIYNADIFDRQTMQMFRQSLSETLNTFAFAPESAIVTLPAFPSPSLPEIAKTARSQKLPLSYHQERIWFVDEFENGVVYRSSPTYHNVPVVLQLSSMPDPRLLEQSLNALVARHEVLRTRIVRSEDGPTLSVRPIGIVTLGQRKVSGSCSRPDAFEKIASEAIREADLPYDLTKDLLVRATLVTFEGHQTILIVTLHHLIADRRSAEIFLRELADIYNTLLGIDTPQLQEVTASYAEFAVWQNRLSEREASWNYWRRQLSGTLTALELPYRAPRPAVHKFTPGVISISFPVDDEIALTPDGLESESFLLGCFVVLLHKYSAQREIVIGTTDSCRLHSVTKDSIGPFSNLLVLRNRVCGDQTVAEVFSNVAETLKQAEANRQMPFDLLVQKLKPKNDMSRTALFDVLFQVESNSTALRLGEAPASVIETNLGYGKYDLNVMLRRREGGLELVVVYNSELLDRKIVECMVHHYQYLVTRLGRAADVLIRDISLLSDAERCQALEHGVTEAGFPKDATVHRLFEAQVKQSPEHCAVKCGAQALSYHQLNARANQLAHFLSGRGVKRGSLVAVALERSVDLVSVTLGVLKAGAAYLPIDPAYPRDRIRLMLQEAKIDFCIGEQSVATQIEDIVRNVIVLRDHEHTIESEVDSNLDVITSSSDVAYCLYTSGSTGVPNGVLVQHKNIVRLLVNDCPVIKPTSDDVWTMFHSYSFDFSVWEMFGALLFGGVLVIVPDAVRQDPTLFVQLLMDKRVTVLNQTPSYFYQLAHALSEERCAGLALKYLIFGAEALQPSLLKSFMERHENVTLINMYGITETTVHVTFHRLSPADIETATSVIGTPIPTTTTYVLDEGMNPAPIGVTGEIYVGGEGVGLGYLNRPGLTAERFVPNPFPGSAGARLYKSGDLARRRRDGALEYVGRADHQLKIRGYRIESGDVELALAQMPSVERAVVVARDTERGEKRLVAYIVLQADSDISKSEMRAHLKRELPEYMVPSAFVFLEKLPLTANGKLDRQALREPDATNDPPALTYIAPRDQIESEIASIWETCLDTRRVGCLDNFFDRGGTSLNALQCLNLIKERLGVAVPVASLFMHPTLEGISKIVLDGAAVSSNATPAILTLQSTWVSRERSGAPVFLVHPLGGYAIVYLELARAMGGDHLVYGIQSPAASLSSNAVDWNVSSIEEVARRYVHQLKSAEPQGPYHLAGWSFGGLIAFEMARQLQEVEASVSSLGLIDSFIPNCRAEDGSKPRREEDRPYPSYPPHFDDAQLLSSVFDPEDRLGVLDLPPASSDERLAAILGGAKSSNLIPAEVDVRLAKRLAALIREHITAAQRYVPSKFSGRVVFFAPSDGTGKEARSNLDHVRTLVTNLEVCRVPGTHASMIWGEGARAIGEWYRT
jgi:amino acid adenylation domain-containing protein